MVKRSREERLEMNRMTARERRRKAKILIGTLQEQVDDLTRHNEDLRRNNALLRAQLTAQNQNGQGTVATISSVGSSSMSTNTAEATGTVASTTVTTTASTSAGSAVSANPSPMAAPTTSTCSTNQSLSDPGTAASLVLRLQQLQKQSQQQPSLASFSSPQINQEPATNPAVMGSTNFQAQIDRLRQQQALRMLGLQVPAQMAMQQRPSVITTRAEIAVPTRPSTISFPTTDLAHSALSTYRQQQQQPSQAISSLASAQIDPQLLANNASAAAILQNLGLLGGTGALPNVASGTANANANVVNVNTNALAQLLPALLGQQQQQDQQSRMPPIPRPNTQGHPPQQ